MDNTDKIKQTILLQDTSPSWILGQYKDDELVRELVSRGFDANFASVGDNGYSIMLSKTYVYDGVRDKDT